MYLDGLPRRVEMRKTKKFKSTKKQSLPRIDRKCEIVVGERVSPSMVVKEKPESLVAVDSAIVCEQIQIVRCSNIRRTSRLFKVVERAIYPVGDALAKDACPVVRMLDASTVVMRVSDVKTFFGKNIGVLPSISFRRCAQSGVFVKKGKG